MTLNKMPPLPGSVIRYEVLKGMHVTQATLARATGVSTVRINQIINGKAPISPDMAIRLGHATSRDAEKWLALQRDYDLFQAERRLKPVLKKLPKLLET